MAGNGKLTLRRRARRVASPRPKSAAGVGKQNRDSTRAALETDAGGMPLSVREAGAPLPQAEQAFFEQRLGTPLDHVRLHTASSAAEDAERLNAEAFTVGSHIGFADGRFQPGSPEGRRLLAHELAHVMQQSSGLQPRIQRQEQPEEEQREEPERPGGAESAVSIEESYEIDYDNAKFENVAYANSLGWGSLLAASKLGLFSEWQVLFDTGKYDQLADAVARYQWINGLEPTGIIDEATWVKIADPAILVAGISNPDGDVAISNDLNPANICTDATECRLRQAAQMEGKTLEEMMPEGKSAVVFQQLLHSNKDALGSLPPEHRGNGAAGAMVYAGMGSYVSEEDVWGGGLLPGAMLQAWRRKSDYEAVKNDAIPPEGLSSSGTSMVFVYYDKDDPQALWAQHFDRLEMVHRGSYQVLIAANPNNPYEPPPVTPKEGE